MSHSTPPHREGPLERCVRFSVERPIPVLLATAFVLALAASSALRLPLDALPDVTPNQVLILTRAPGLTPEEIELRVTRPLEVALGGVPGLSERRALSRFGLSAITAVFEDSVDPYRARQLVLERVGNFRGPEEADAPEIGPYSGGLGEIFQFTLTGRSKSELLELVETRVAPILRSVPGVVEVNPWGGARRTFDVRADPDRLAARGITLAELSEALAAATGARPGATLLAGSGQILLRATARPETPAALGEAVVARDEATGAVIRVRDVAEVGEGFEPRIGAATQDGKGEVVYVMAQMLRGENALSVMGRLETAFPEVRRALPQDVSLTVIYDRSQLVRRTLRTVGLSLAEGGALVMLVLFALLGSVRAGLVVSVAIPASMIVAAAAMTWAGVPGNLMSLGAIDFGLVVDGSVVMVERLFHAQGAVVYASALDRRRALGNEAAAVARPVFFSVLVILAVYLPVLLLEGVDGKMFRPMALTMVFALSASLALALTAIPALASLVLRPKDVPARDPLALRALRRGFLPALDWVMRHRRNTALVAVLLLGGGVWLLARIETAFVPELDEGDLVLQTNRHADISLDEAVRQAGLLEARLIADVAEVVSVASRIGSPAIATDVMGIEQADVFVKLAPRDTWTRSRAALIEAVQRAAEAAQPGELSLTQPIQMRFNELIGGDVNDVAISVYGEDQSAIRATANRIATLIEGVPGAVFVRVMSPPEVPLAEIRPRVLDLARYGLTARDVLEYVAALRLGLPISSTYLGPIEVPIRLRLAGAESAFQLGALKVPLPGGGQVPLAAVADVVQRSTPTLLNRKDGARRVVVGFNVESAALGRTARAVTERLSRELVLPDGVRIAIGGQVESLERARSRLLLVMPLALALVLGLLVLAFGALRPALILLAHVPFAVLGGVALLALRGMPISLSAAIGFIALAGIAVLNGVVLMHELRAREAAGLAPAEAAKKAAETRLRPVAMTALVAAFGFVPMALATGVGAEVQRPLATVVVGGLVTSTLLTLLILPALYPWFAQAGKSASASALSREKARADDST